MSSTFTGPLRVNTRQTTSNDGTISADNTGATVLSQQAAIAGATAATIVIPAGSIVQGISNYITTAATTGATGNVTIGSTTIAGLTNVTGVNAGAFTTGVTGVALLANVGATDATISYTAGAGAVGVLSVTYTQRNPDGTIAPYGSGYTNN
jgi:hypothetical protein